MTEKELRQKVVDTAKAWHGFKQSNGSHREIIDVYNSHRPLARGYAVTYTDPWCATYTSAVGIKLGIADIMFPECSCPQQINLYKKAGRWVEDDAYVPQIGDLVQYDWQDSGKGDNTGTPDHIGIVCSVSGATMQIIEGNLSYAVGYRTLMVNARYIRGYCCPDYASKATAEPAEPEAVTTYTVQASAVYHDKAAAEAALAKIKAMGFTGSFFTKEAAPAKAIKVGDTVKVKQGVKYYDGKTPNPTIYNRVHTVHSMKGDRVVIAVGKIIIGAVHKDNLILVD